MYLYNKHFSTHLNRIPAVVAQKEFFHNFTPPIAEILAFTFCLCCQKVDFSGPISLPQLDIPHFGQICFNNSSPLSNFTFQRGIGC